MEQQENRRRHERYPCDRPFEGELPPSAPQKQKTFRCRAVNASEGGMLVETPMQLEVGQRIELFLKSRDLSRAFIARVEVRWTESQGDGFRSGVMFLSRREDYVI